MQDLHIDIETYSSVDIKTSGAYKYVESPDFEILMVAFAFDNEEVQIVDLTQGEELPGRFMHALHNNKVRKHAHNATFERIAFRAIGIDTPASEWYCSAIKAAYCGFPLGLAAVSEAMGLGDKGKDSAGKALIKYFSCPVKATKTNGMRTRNFPEHDLGKWGQFKDYCKQDVVAERAILKRLEAYTIPPFEREMYILDQKINDRGILIDLDLAKKATEMDALSSSLVLGQMKGLTGLDNPNSAAQLKKWLGEHLQKEVKTLAKDAIPQLIEEASSDAVKEVLTLRTKAAKASTKKYIKMLQCACDDTRAHGLLQFYGASRTGRWAGRLVQLQNLPQNHLDDLQGARDAVASGDFELVSMLYDDVASLLSQLIRTAFIAKEGHTFAVADFSAIEARVIAWLAGEQWRLDVFNSHGKIYEASASMMFDVPIDAVTKGSDYRAKGKVAELALGYQGAVGALKTMGGEKMGLSEIEMENIVAKWRAANPAIVKMWKAIENCAKRAVRTQSKCYLMSNTPQALAFECDGKALTIELPSGRKLFYQSPRFALNKFKQESIQYRGMDQLTHKWSYIDTYGGKLTENIIQAIARDLLAVGMQRIDRAGLPIVMHVHDEAICEVWGDNPKVDLKTMCNIMGRPIEWAEGLPLTADGYVTPFYKKD